MHGLGVVPNLFALARVAYASSTASPADTQRNTASCPKPSDIQSRPYTDPDIPAPYGEGYQYSADVDGKTWNGQTAGTHDDYLADTYKLKVKQLSERNGKLFCDYEGNRLVTNGEVADAYLRLSTPK